MCAGVAAAALAMISDNLIAKYKWRRVWSRIIARDGVL
jgi:hypothetical protein